MINIKNNTVRRICFGPNSKATLDIENYYSFLFIVFLILCFVGLSVFSERIEIYAEETGGDVVRQIVFLTIFTIIVLSLLRKYSFSFLQFYSLPVICTVILVFVSIFWSDYSLISFRRFVYLLVIILVSYSFVLLLDPDIIIYLLAYTLLLLVIVSLVSGLFVQNAVHHLGEQGGTDLIGLWRGVFYHKNKAGEASALLIIMSLFLFIGSNKKRWVLALIFGVTLLILSFSKTSLIAIGPSIIMGLVWSYMIKSNVKYSMFILLAICVINVAFVLYVEFYETLKIVLTNPFVLTGRGALWMSLTELIKECPYLGFGYGGVYYVGINSPFVEVAPEWAITLGDGHNGYLDLLVHLGITGFSLFIFAFILQPIYRLLSLNIPPHLSGMFFSLIVFVAIQNLSETNFLYRERSPWVVLIIVLSLIQYFYLRRDTPARKK